MSLTAAPAGGVTLFQLITQLDGIKHVWGPDQFLSGINADSRTIQPGEIFVAITGERNNGHDFIPQAMKRNCAGLIIENIPAKKWLQPNITIIQVESSRRALSQLAAAFYGHPAQQLTCVGVTGTCGKTTTSFLINHILEKLQYKTGLLGTLWQKVGTAFIPSDITTPEPIKLQRLLADMREQRISHAVMEVSSHSLCQDRVINIPFTTAVFTNFGREHLNYHKSPANYLAAKTRLFSSLAPTAFAILNLDDPATAMIKFKTPAQIITYGTDSNADLIANNINLTWQGLACTINLRRLLPINSSTIINHGQWPLHLPLLGRHNISNILGAFGAALSLGLQPKKICHALASFQGVSRRLQVIFRGPFTIIDDFGHNETSLNALFATIATMKYRNLVIVNYLKGTRGIEANQITAEHIAAAAKKLRIKQVISTRSDSHVIPKNKVQPEEERAFTTILTEAGLPVINTRELPDAVQLGLKVVGNNDILLLLGPSGMDAGADLARHFLQEQGYPLDYAPLQLAAAR